MTGHSSEGWQAASHEGPYAITTSARARIAGGWPCKQPATSTPREPSQILDHHKGALLQFEGFDRLRVNPLVIGIGAQALHGLAVGCPIGKRQHGEDLAGIRPTVQLPNLTERA